MPEANASDIRRDGTVLGFDVGARRIGVAVGSAFGHARARWRWSTCTGTGPTGTKSTACAANGGRTASSSATR